MSMPSCCLLERLPVELLHTLFDYFTTADIFSTFFNLNNCLNSIVCSYPNHRLHFRSIERSHFRLICQHVRPEQVISLILSDANDTPGLSTFFFTHFRLEQFNRPQSLTLLQIEHKSLDRIFSDLHKLTRLRVLSFNNQTIRYEHSLQDLPNSFVVKDDYIRSLSQLNRLHLSNSTLLPLNTFPHLRHVKIEECFANEFQRILQHASRLTSLSVNVNLSRSPFNFSSPNNRLRELRLEIKNYCVSMNEMEQFLAHFPCLKHLELRAAAQVNIADGNRWEALVSSLVTFHFKFNVSLPYPDGHFLSFLTPFWMEEKRWFVAYHNSCLFSLLHFAPAHINSTDLSQFTSTAPDLSLLFDRAKTLTVTTLPFGANQRLAHIKVLELNHSILPPVLQSVIHLTKLKHSIIPSLSDLLLFLPLEEQVCQLNALTIRGQITTAMIEQFESHQFKQITKLELTLTESNRDSIFEDLFALFPSVQNLQNHNGIQCTATMIRLIDGFPSLTNASFSFVLPVFADRSLSSSTSIIRHPRRLAESKCTRRLYHSTSKSVVECWWIDSWISDGH